MKLSGQVFLPFKMIRRSKFNIFFHLSDGQSWTFLYAYILGGNGMIMSIMNY